MFALVKPDVEKRANECAAMLCKCAGWGGRSMNPWLLLAFAIAGEVIATTSLRFSQGFTRPLPVVFVVLGYRFAI